MSFNQLRCSFVCKLTFFFLGSTVGKGKESGKSHRKREFGILRPHQKYPSHILLNIYSCITYFIKYLSKSPKYICTFNMYIYLYIHLKSVICKTLKVWLLTIKLCNENQSNFKKYCMSKFKKKQLKRSTIGESEPKISKCFIY